MHQMKTSITGWLLGGVSRVMKLYSVLGVQKKCSSSQSTDENVLHNENDAEVQVMRSMKREIADDVVARIGH